MISRAQSLSGGDPLDCRGHRRSMPLSLRQAARTISASTVSPASLMSPTGAWIIGIVAPEYSALGEWLRFEAKVPLFMRSEERTLA